MSKKIASGADAIVLDVKTGSGAFMREEAAAKELATTMVDIGNGYGRETVAIVSDMNQPLGNGVGNILEVKEAIATLKGQGPEDLYELCLQLGTQMVRMAKVTDSESEARAMLEEVVANGQALEKLKAFVEAQGGDSRSIDNPDLFDLATIIEPVKAEKSGYINHIETEEIGFATMMLGGGRETKDSIIDLAVGYVFEKKLGAYVEAGDTIAMIHANDMDKMEASRTRFLKAITIGQDKAEVPALIKGMIK